MNTITHSVKRKSVLVNSLVQYLTVLYIPYDIFVSAPPVFDNILIEKRGDRQQVGLIILNRPKALNALSQGIIEDIKSALAIFDKDKEIAAIVVTGSEKAFAAGKCCNELSITI